MVVGKLFVDLQAAGSQAAFGFLEFI